jgi:hypothetical protein
MNSLATVLRYNAASCLFFGLAFAIAPAWISGLIGNSAPWILRIIGLGLAFHGLHLLLASRRSRVVCPEVIYFILGDLGWVLATVVLFGLGIGITSSLGIAFALLVAAMVGTLGFLQFRHARKLCA